MSCTDSRVVLYSFCCVRTKVRRPTDEMVTLSSSFSTSISRPPSLPLATLRAGTGSVLTISSQTRSIGSWLLLVIPISFAQKKRRSFIISTTLQNSRRSSSNSNSWTISRKIADSLSFLRGTFSLSHKLIHAEDDIVSFKFNPKSIQWNCSNWTLRSWLRRASRFASIKTFSASNNCSRSLAEGTIKSRLSQVLDSLLGARFSRIEEPEHTL